MFEVCTVMMAQSTKKKRISLEFFLLYFTCLMNLWESILASKVTLLEGFLFSFVAFFLPNGNTGAGTILIFSLSLRSSKI